MRIFAQNLHSMDIAYVIGTGSKWQNNELRYSLRSIDRYGQGLGEVYIIGDELPDFIEPSSVRFLQVKDAAPGRPQYNCALKIRHLFENTDVDRFLLSSDDHFFIRPVCFDRWPLHYKGKEMPSDDTKGVGDARYTRAMADTRRFMERHRLDLRYWEGHTNKLYTRAAWEYLTAGEIGEDFFRTMEAAKYGICVNSPMQAVVYQQEAVYMKVGVCQRKDVKLRHLNTPEDWELLKDTESFSIYDSAINTGVAGLLQVLFPDKCRFEKKSIFS